MHVILCGQKVKATHESISRGIDMQNLECGDDRTLGRKIIMFAAMQRNVKDIATDRSSSYIKLQQHNSTCIFL